ncbi:13856_t:CDS:2 [Ambispora leptoticha]|uniref:13856_t:CDS:1 n=1 Tax=Ambispora leptoticha TaxID=144679 RepID=A0A9N8YNF4_9GLOM|nr:13856_t:CDS:2 [Ambispora leptoticha]
MIDWCRHFLPNSLDHQITSWKMHEARNIRNQRRARESFSKADSDSRMNLSTDLLEKLQKERYTTQAIIEELECRLYGKEPSKELTFKDIFHRGGSNISDISEIGEMTKDFTFPAYSDLEAARKNQKKSFMLKDPPIVKEKEEEETRLDKICDSLTKLLEEAQVALSQPVQDETVMTHGRKESVDTAWDSASTISAQSEQIMTPVDCEQNGYFDVPTLSRHSSISSLSTSPRTPGSSFMEEMFDDEPIEKPLPPPLTTACQQSCENLENEFQRFIWTLEAESYDDNNMMQENNTALDCNNYNYNYVDARYQLQRYLNAPTTTTANIMNDNDERVYFDEPEEIKQDENALNRAKLQQFISNVSTVENLLAVTGFLFGFAQIIMAIRCRSSNRLIDQSPNVLQQNGKKSIFRVLKYLGVFSVGWAVGRNSNKQSKQQNQRRRRFL